jgi:hypothetical protein
MSSASSAIASVQSSANQALSQASSSMLSAQARASSAQVCTPEGRIWRREMYISESL